MGAPAGERVLAGKGHIAREGLDRCFRGSVAGEGGTGSERPVKGQLLGKVIQLKRGKAGHRLGRDN